VIPKLSLKTRLSLIVHAKELKRTTNTGRLAIEALTNSEMFIRGKIGELPDLSSLISDDYESVVLYPSDDAIDISELRATKPVHLIVGDGNWRQAAKINTRYPELNDLKRVKVHRLEAATAHLRKEHFEEGMATLEAIALAFRVLEGEEVGEKLMALYRAKLQATLVGRGVESTSDAREPE
jgi:DTW domain-containing protein YfiP